MKLLPAGAELLGVHGRKRRTLRTERQAALSSLFQLCETPKNCFFGLFAKLKENCFIILRHNHWNHTGNQKYREATLLVQTSDIHSAAKVLPPHPPPHPRKGDIALCNKHL